MIQRESRKALDSAELSLDAAAEFCDAPDSQDLKQLASKHGVDPESLTTWFDYLGIGSPAAAISTYLSRKITNSDKYDFIKGWGGDEALSFVTNSSDQVVRIPGTMKPHSVAMHPMPKLRVAVGWRSPVTGKVTVEAAIQRAHLDCGAGVTWSLQLRHGPFRQVLAKGAAHDGALYAAKPGGEVGVQKGDLLSIVVGPIHGDHTCGLTSVDFTVRSGSDGREWNLAADVAPDPLAGNPHADKYGNNDVWNFYSELNTEAESGVGGIPSSPLLTQWKAASSEGEKHQISKELQKRLSPGASSEEAVVKGITRLVEQRLTSDPDAIAKLTTAEAVQKGSYGLDPALFGRSVSGAAIDRADLLVSAPSVLEVSIPAELADGSEFVTGAAIDPGTQECVQAAVTPNAPPMAPGSSSPVIVPDAPFLAANGSEARKAAESALADFRDLFPSALCYAKIVPVDEVITLLQFYREDDQLVRLMLDDREKARLDRLWDELHYVSRDALTTVDAFEQLWQYATQDADPKVLEPMREPIKQRAAEFRQRLLDTEPLQLESVIQFADSAYRRPLAEPEKQELRNLYTKLRTQEMPHDDALRLVMARIFVSPAFLYHAEKPGPGTAQEPVSDWELANRLSYFLWSSAPDDELRGIAASGTLKLSEVLRAQTRRMLRDARARRIATEFGCSWLHIRDFEETNEKSEKEFPTFAGLRGDMLEESVQFFTDFFQNDRSILGLLSGDYTYLNESLAAHYGIPDVKGAEWRRVEGVRKYSRGGILAQASTLSKQSGASRTSPILRGSWIVETLLGEKLPKPPKDVPKLPEEEAAQSLTVRELTERHTSDARCAGCHERFDAFGFALEKFDAIGRYRENDMGNRPLNTKVTLPDGVELDGAEGLRKYLLNERRETFVRQFCRKLLGYALGRSVQLSDEPLLKEIQINLAKNDYHIGTAVEMIVQSRQFREIRGQDAPLDE